MDDWRRAAAAHRSGDLPRVPPVADLPPAIGDLVAACLSPDPAQRPSARQVAAQLSAARDRGPTLPAAALATTTPVGTTAATFPAAVPTRYAVGSAPLPPPPTRVDSAAPVSAAGTGRGRLLMAGAGAAAVVLGL